MKKWNDLTHDQRKVLVDTFIYEKRYYEIMDDYNNGIIDRTLETTLFMMKIIDRFSK